VSKGIENCEDAFKRLIDGKPHKPEHVGLQRSKITAGTVSVEAGYDRGYLKKARPVHALLIARIDAFRAENPKNLAPRVLEVSRAKSKIDRLLKSEKLAKEMSYKLMTRNLLLIERIRELENQLSKYQNVHEIRV